MADLSPTRTAEARSYRRVIEQAIAVLREQLPTSWSVALELEPGFDKDWRPDAVITIKGSGTRKSSRLLVEYKNDVTPRVASNAAAQLKAFLGRDPEAAGVVIAPWGSRRTREVLRQSGVGFIDPTGNIDLVVENSGLVVRVDGADDNPLGKPAASPNLRGPKAWSLMKTMIEVKPPYGVRELADAVDTDPGYTSRVIQALAEERLLSRQRRGPVTDVDWRAMLTQLTSTYGLLDANTTSTWIARSAVRSLPQKLAGSRLQTRWAITGSLGAYLIAPVAVGGGAFIYADDPAEVAETLDLLPADSGINVIVARPYGDAAYVRNWLADGATYVSLPQLAADCLTGGGRMPSEGEALVEWMAANEDRWRGSGFDDDPNPLDRS